MSAANKTTRSLILVTCLLCLALPVPAAQLSRPAGLEPDIAFWRRVFTEISSEQGMIHDDRYLGVIYGVVKIPPGSSRSKRRRLYDQAATGYKAALDTLASGKRQGLSAEEARILALWPKDVSAAELRKAKTRLRMQQGLADRFREGLIRSGRWKNHIYASLDAAGVPRELAALPHVESSFNPEAYSHVGAAGMWQFTRSTGKRFMRVDHVVDERRDPFRSSEAAAQLLQYNYSMLQSWPLAITAYNHGVAGMRRAVQQQGSSDIEKILRNYDGRTFGFASRNFYVAFLAAFESERNAARYFGAVTPENPSHEYSIVMPYYVPADTLSDALGVPLTTLQALNSALMPPVWDGNKHVPRGYSLRLPGASLANSARANIDAIPAQQRYAAQTPDKFHKIRRGDTLSGIASRYNTSVSQLLALNGLSNRHRIRAGKTLRLPYEGHSAPVQLAANDTTPATSVPLPAPVPVRPAATVKKPPPATDPAVDEVATIGALATSPEESDATSEDRLLADPSDYLVAADNSIEVQAEETLGHYADWLELPTQRLRDLNGYSYRRPLIVGKRLKLDFAKVKAGEFAARRVDFHRELQEAFFSRYRISRELVHEIRRGDSLWALTQQRYRLPLWLLRQYNPDLDLQQLVPGTKVVIPQVTTIAAGSDTA